MKPRRVTTGLGDLRPISFVYVGFLLLVERYSSRLERGGRLSESQKVSCISGSLAPSSLSFVPYHPQTITKHLSFSIQQAS